MECGAIMDGFLAWCAFSEKHTHNIDYFRQVTSKSLKVDGT